MERCGVQQRGRDRAGWTREEWQKDNGRKGDCLIIGGSGIVARCSVVFCLFWIIAFEPPGSSTFETLE